MLSSLILAVVGATAFITQAMGHVIPGTSNSNPSGVLILGRTPPQHASQVSWSATASATANPGGSNLEIKITNNASDKLHGYILGQDPVNGKKVFYQTGAAVWYYPTCSAAPTNCMIDTESNNVTIEIGGNSATTVTMTKSLDAGRVYIGVDEMTFMLDPSGYLVEPSPVDQSDSNYGFSWGFVELLWWDAGLVADISHVDAVGLALGLRVTTTDGQELYDTGLPAGSLEKVCSELAAVGSDWGDLCIRGIHGKLIRAMAPSKYVKDSTPLSTFYDSYIDEVWEKYSTTQLTVNTQESTWSANVTCKVSDGGDSPMLCAQPDGATFSYAKPKTVDVLGCGSGPFADQGVNQYQSRTWRGSARPSRDRHCCLTAAT